jgi:hypothetical protein
MPDLTVQQADELANQALSLKVAVGKFRNRFFDILTPEQRDGLRTLATELGDEVDHLTAVAIKLSLADLQETLAHLRNITNGVNSVVAHMGNLRKVLTVATALASFGAAITLTSPDTMLSALKDTLTAIQE